jgi:Tol biopolymer transport system component
MKHRTKSISILLGLLLVAAIAVLAVSGGALTSLAELFSTSPLAPPPSPTALRGLQSSPLGTPVPLPQWTAIPIPVATTMPTIPPPPGYPTGEPWPPQVTSEPPQPTPTRPPSLAPTGFPPDDVESLYYVADNAGYPELYAVGMDIQGRRQSEFMVISDSTLGSTNLVGLYLSPDGRYMALEFLGDGYGEVSIMERPSGRTWCPLREPASCWGGFRGWMPDDQFLFQPFDVPPEGVVPMGVIILDPTTGQYRSLDLPVEPEWGYSLTQNVSPSPDGFRLVYSVVAVEDGEEIAEIWTMQMDGQDKQLIHRVKGGVSCLSWSPNGGQILYVYQSEPGQFFPGELHLLNTDAGSNRLLATDLPMPGESRYCPVWSPDGRHIAFVQLDSPPAFHPTLALASGNAYAVDTATGQVVRLSSFEKRDVTYPVWSPDGRFVAFVSTIIPSGEQILPGELSVVSADGSQRYALSGTVRWGNALAWLPPISTEEMR